MEIQTDRLILKSDCTVINGQFTYPHKKISPLLDLQPDNGESSGFAIYLKDTYEVVGHINIHFKRKPYELSIGMIEKYRNQGFMKEAHAAVIGWIFNNCETDSITALVGNISPAASRKILQYYGFTRVEEDQEEWWILKRCPDYDLCINVDMNVDIKDDGYNHV